MLGLWASATVTGLRKIRLCCCLVLPSPPLTTTTNVASTSLSSCLLKSSAQTLLLVRNADKASSSFSSFAHTPRSGSRGRGRSEMKGDCESSRGRDAVAMGKDRIHALGRLLTRILRHMATELNLNVRSDGYVRVQELLKLNLKTFANIPLRSHSVDDIREAVRKDNKQRFSLLEENGELLIRANQGHSMMTVETESLLKPILSAEETPGPASFPVTCCLAVCVHGTYKKNLESILQSGLKRMKRLHVHFSCGLPTDGDVISGMRRDVNVLIFLDVKKALEEEMKLYMSDNMVILTEGFDAVLKDKSPSCLG
ncbi:hypothetical protein Nepgr_002436 [Nepenthes gracilis]|uniref:2'-phosphotransferase n=1 Tax=Nepenthes gracilis TaxID=150966 RepID=A0AAD3P717_NEPGR|nr:hypothetical protein Nepgr_002436 [Nepenthes gracilis]